MKAKKKTARQTARQALPGLAKRGFTQADAARELNVSRQRVSQLVAELGLKFRPATPEVPEKRLKELAAKRLTQAEIARELGVSSSRVGRIARKLNVQLAPVWSRPKAPTTKLGKTLQTARLDAGYSYRRLGRIAGLHPRHVAAIEVGRVQ